MTTLDTSSSHRVARRLTLPPTPLPQVLDRSRAAATLTPAQAVQVAARAISRNLLNPVCAPGAGVAFQPRSMLAVPAYCYASEVYCSTDIEDFMRCDASIRELCGNEIPDASTLRRFRRHNREAIEHCLCEVLRQMAEQAGVHAAEAEIQERAHQQLATAILMDMHEKTDLEPGAQSATKIAAEFLRRGCEAKLKN